MKLTVYQREAIVRSIMNDVPAPSETKLRADVQAALVAAMSPEVRALYQTHPKALVGDRQHFNSIRTSSWFIKGDADWCKTMKPFMDAENAREGIQRDLTNALKSCVTLKRAKAMFPEFVKYMPTESEPSKNLPAVTNVVSGLVSMGWPKDSKPSKVAK